MNLIAISGRLTRDVEMKTLPSGQLVGKFGVAVDGAKDKNGNRHTDFFNCQAWGGTADTLAKYLHKGDPIEIVGTMESYVDNKTTYWTVNVRTWNFTLSKPKGNESGAHNAVVNGLREATAEESADLPF